MKKILSFDHVVSILNLILIVGGGLYFRNYLPSYYSEKGKNIATKEDVQELTRLVESVRAEYAINIEKYKSDLSSDNLVVEKRRLVYEKMCKSLGVFIEGHNDSQADKDEFYSAYGASWLWASDTVLMSVNQLLIQNIKASAVPNSIDQPTKKLAYSSLILLMRKDVGFKSTKMKNSDYQFIVFAPHR
jgi:hypothetical protein